MKFKDPRFSITINMPTRAALFRAVRDRFAAGKGFGLATLNLDHLAKLPNDPAFAEAYAKHDLIVADGRPIVWLSRLARKPVDLMPGSDLIIPLCAIAAERGVKVALVGSSEEALEGAAHVLRSDIPGIDIALIYSPPYGFDPTGEGAKDICKMLNDADVGLCITALGAPKQELFGAFAQELCPRVGFASTGAGLDFLAGLQVRAPKILRKMALEWLWRAAQDPKRMVPRYAQCFAILPRLTQRAWMERSES